MARTTAEQVRSIISGLPAGVDVTPQIEAASILVDNVCSASGYAAQQFEMIERYLAAHFVAIDRRRTGQAGVSEGAQQTFDRVEVDLYLDNTTYGQHAIALDTDGSLASYNNTLKTIKTTLPAAAAGVVWLGRRCRD